MHNMVTKSNRISCISMHWATTTNQPRQTEKKKKKKKEIKDIIHDGSSQSHAQGSLFLLHHFKGGSRKLDHYPASLAKLAI